MTATEVRDEDYTAHFVRMTKGELAGRDRRLLHRGCAFNGHYPGFPPVHTWRKAPEGHSFWPPNGHRLSDKWQQERVFA